MQHLSFFTFLIIVVIGFLSCGFETSHALSVPRVDRRGFKSSLLSTARGFGKRSGLRAMQLEPNAYENMRPSGAMPVPLFAEELNQNPRLLSAVAEMMDTDDDGYITPRELYRLSKQDSSMDYLPAPEEV